MRLTASRRLGAAVLSVVASVAIATAAPGRGAAAPPTGPCTRSTGFAICLIDPAHSPVSEHEAPAGDEVATGDRDQLFWLLARVAVGEDGVAGAAASIDPHFGPVVLVKFNDKGRQRFAAFTGASVGSRAALLVDGAVVSTPVILDPILGGKAMITGNFSIGTAQALADRINAARTTSRR